MFDDAYNSDRDEQLSALLNSGQLNEAMLLLEDWYAREPWNGEVLMRMAVVHWLAGEPARTLRDLDAYLLLDPDNAEALARRAQALLMLGKHEDAEAALSQAEAIDPQTPGVLLNRALILEEHGHLADAVTSLTAYLQEVPTDHLALARRSHLHRQLGHLHEALADARECVAMHPEDPETHFAEALAHVTLEDGEVALAACDRCLAAQPGFLPALRLKIDLLADLGRVQEADIQLKSLASHDPESPATALLYARVAAERNDFDSALQWIDRYLQDAPDQAHGYYRRGMLYLRMRDIERALADFQEYVALNPTGIEGYEQQFMCYLELGRMADAVRVGEEAIKLQPQNYRLQFNLAFANLVMHGMPVAGPGFAHALALAPENDDLALRVYLALLEHATREERRDFLAAMLVQLSPPANMIRGLLAETHMEGGEYEQALTLTRRILADDPTRPFGYLIGIKALCLLNRYEDAMALADIGMAELPQDGQIRLARAVVLRDTGQPEAALRELNEAERLLPEDAEVARQRALVYGSIGQLDDAIAALFLSLQRDAESTESYFWLGYFHIHLQDYAGAMNAADHLLALLPDSPEGHFVRGVALRGLHRTVEATQEIAWVRQADPLLLERLSSDPVIAGLLNREPQGMWARIRQGVSRRRKGLRASE